MKLFLSLQKGFSPFCPHTWEVSNPSILQSTCSCVNSFCINFCQRFWPSMYFRTKLLIWFPQKKVQHKLYLPIFLKLYANFAAWSTLSTDFSAWTFGKRWFFTYPIPTIGLICRSYHSFLSCELKLFEKLVTYGFISEKPSSEIISHFKQKNYKSFQKKLTFLLTFSSENQLFLATIFVIFTHFSTFLLL